MNKVFTVTNAMFLLWERAIDNLTKEEMEWFAGVNDMTTGHVTHLKTLVEGVGFLVQNDVNSGNFQSSDDLPSLLFSIANGLDSIEALVLLTTLVSRGK
ncbi:MAG: hypothetical protein DID92_2727743063 [Candidatus Nitrotoga sp. SPKER]|nr:MAG: hypothetical protein DID92_2727743063 [Candidatus Nitrotoga sp. SPKER]